ncbi:hypothetical protein EJB05_12676, partial [Eragrostis curvula]
FSFDFVVAAYEYEIESKCNNFVYASLLSPSSRYVGMQRHDLHEMEMQVLVDLGVGLCMRWGCRKLESEFITRSNVLHGDAVHPGTAILIHGNDFGC